MSWDTELEVMKFGNIEIHVESSTDDYSRRVVQYDYPYKDGAELEDLGRQPRPTSFAAVFFGDNYIPLLVDFLQEVDKGKTQTLQHPIFGQWQAKCVSAVVNHTHERRDSAAVDLEFLEDGVNTVIPDVFSIGATQTELSEDADTLQAALDDLNVDVPTVPTFLTDVEAFIEDVDDQVTDLESRIDKLKRSAQEAVTELEEKVNDAINWEAVKSVRRCVNSAQKLKERVERLAPKITNLEIVTHTPLAALALKLYKDPARADELMKINKLRNPFLVPPGASLKVYSE